MASPIGSTCGPVRLAFTVVQTLTTQGALIDSSIITTREWHAVVLKLVHCIRGFFAHVMNGILVTKPVTSFDCVVEMPPPVIFRHVTQSSIDATLSSDSVGARWKLSR